MTTEVNIHEVRHILEDMGNEKIEIIDRPWDMKIDIRFRDSGISVPVNLEAFRQYNLIDSCRLIIE